MQPAAAVALATTLIVGSTIAASADDTVARPESRCEAFAPTSTTSGSQIEGVGLEAASATSPSLCVISGRISSSADSTIHFRLDLPNNDSWNGKLIFIGGGGFDGIVPTENPAMRAALKQLGTMHKMDGYAFVATDSGHQGRGKVPYADFSWAAHNPVAVRNHAYAANHQVLWTAVDLVKQFYGREPAQRYMVGRSNGGRSGLIAAQRYPQDYHGIVALVPAISQQGYAANMTPMLRHIFSSPDNWMNAEQIKLFEQAQLAACDELDNLKDGIMGNAAACHYDASALSCKAGEQGSATCLTAGQIDSIRMIYSDKRINVTLADGIIGYPGHGRGAEFAEWPPFIFGTTFPARDSFDYIATENIIRHGITDDPNASVMTHEPEQWSKQYLALSNEIDATNPDLSAFKKNGGKLIVWFGLADGCVSYKRTADYVQSVEALMGHDAARAFLRFYTSPGVGHTGPRGPGADSIDVLGALETWVEKGRAPSAIVASKLDSQGKVAFTRPLCEYPAYARYKGKGDSSKAASFVCTPP